MLQRSPNPFQQYRDDVAALPPDDPPGEWWWEEWNKNAIKSRLRRADLKAHKRDPLVALRHKLPLSVMEAMRSHVARLSPQERDRAQSDIETLHRFIALALAKLKP